MRSPLGWWRHHQDVKHADAVLAAAAERARHKLRHPRPHPNGGTWPYAKPICECDQFNEEV